jgi:uncharacterized membrane protein
MATEVQLERIRAELSDAVAESRRESEPAPPEPPPPEAEPAEVEPRAPIEWEPERPPRAAFDARALEALLAGRWLNLAGLLLVFLGTAFFLKVAFDHEWIAPAYRVALGMVSGAVAVAYAQRLAAKGQAYFAEGLTALGCAIEFLSLYASSSLFHLASPGWVLAGMVAVNAVVAALAWRHRSVRLGVLAAIGGFLAPALAGTQASDPWVLVAYIALLDTALLLLGELLDSQILAPMALAGTALYTVTSFSFASTLTHVDRAVIYVTLYAAFAGAGWIVARVRGKLDPVRTIVNAAAFVGLLIGLESSLAPEHRAPLAGALLVLTVLHLTAATICKSRYHSWLATAALTLSVPAAFDGATVNVAWALEAAVVAIAGLRFRDDALRVAGIVLLSSTVVRDIAFYGAFAPYVPKYPFLNERFASGLAAFLAIYAMAFDTTRNGVETYDGAVVRVLRIAGHCIALALLSAEAWAAVQYFGGTLQGASTALSVVWAAFGALFIGWGLFKRDAMLRWEGLGLVVVTAAKVLVFDLSFLDLGYRVVSAVLVGIALIGISYAYQRRAKDEIAQ